MIRIVPYDTAWPAQFAAEAQRLRDGLGPLALRIDHVGSTSVPGLAAKPVIDIQVSVRDLAPLSQFEPSLAALGYTHLALGDFDRVYPFFQRPATWPSTHHVHLCQIDSLEESRHLAFRDWLRVHPEACRTYEALKRKLAATHDGATLASRERYSLAKTGFIESILHQALGAP